MQEEQNLISKNFHVLYKYDTEYSADSVEWCPHEPNKNIFVCGNYQLSKEEECHTDKRLGRILLFCLCSTSGLKLLQKLDIPAVLDQKWCHNQVNGNSLLGVVHAKNSLEIYKLENKSLKFVTSHTFDTEENENLILSLDWSTGKYESSEPYLVCSDSKGYIHILQLSDNELVLKHSWFAHGFETWITGFYYWDTNIIFSGGDDSMFLKFDKRVGSIPVAKNKQHEAGVTSFHSNKAQEYTIATGSYDEHLRLWDIRNIKNPTTALKMPGPLWRLKWDPFKQQFLLAACMLGGVHIVETYANKDMAIVGSCYEHKNISYGADWSYLTEKEGSEFGHGENVILGTCSFYDHLLCISEANCKLE